MAIAVTTIETMGSGCEVSRDRGDEDAKAEWPLWRWTTRCPEKTTGMERIIADQLTKILQVFAPQFAQQNEKPIMHIMPRKG